MKQFSEAEIVDVFNKHVNKPHEYYKKYEDVPLKLNTKKWKWETHDWARIPCFLDMDEWFRELRINHFGKVLSTCHGDPELEYIACDNLVIAEYKDGKNDLHTLNLPDKDFDLIMFHQTIEHLYNPFVAVDNLYAHLKVGGYLFTSAPTINIPHMMPFHFNGYTPMGLCMLMMSAGFKVINIGFWGNMEYIDFMFRFGTWPNYMQLMHDGKIVNEPGKHVQSWVLVTK